MRILKWAHIRSNSQRLSFCDWWREGTTLYAGILLSRYAKCHKNLQFHVFFCFFIANDLEMSLYVPTQSSCMKKIGGGRN